MLFRSKKWLAIVGILLVIALGAGLYAYKEYMRKPKTALEVETVFTLSPHDISKSFMDDEQKANKTYSGKAIAITGAISDMKTDENGNRTIIFSDSSLNMTIIASMDSTNNVKAAGLKSGDNICVKGFFVGFDNNELLGSQIQFKRCAIIDNK